MDMLVDTEEKFRRTDRTRTPLRYPFRSTVGLLLLGVLAWQFWKAEPFVSATTAHTGPLADVELAQTPSAEITQTSGEEPAEPPAPDDTSESEPGLSSSPAPQGFFDLRLGMSRREVHALLERWGKRNFEGSRYGSVVADPPYEGVERIAVLFADGHGLQRDGRGYGSPLRSAAHMTAELAEVPLELIIVSFRQVKGTPDAFRDALQEQYGPPAVISQTNRASPFSFSMDIGLFEEIRDGLAWQWLPEDRSVVAQFSRFGTSVSSTVERRGTSAVKLVFGQGQITRSLISTMFELERAWRERERASHALRTLQAGVGSVPAARPEFPLEQGDGLANIPTILFGTWVMQGRDRDGTLSQGYLTIAPGPQPKQGSGSIEWLVGPRFGQEPLRVTVLDTKTPFLGFLRSLPITIVFLQQGKKKSATADELPIAYVAALRDGRLIAGEKERDGLLRRWQAEKVPAAPTAKDRAKRAIDGTWQFAGIFDQGKPRWIATCVLKEMDERLPLRRITGRYQGRWTGWGRAPFEGPLAGSYNPLTGRLWLKDFPNFVGGVDLDSVAYLESDGERLRVEDDRWKGIRDELVPTVQTRWNLSFPSAGHPNIYTPEDRTLLEAILDGYDIALAVPATAAQEEYLLLGKKDDVGKRSISRTRGRTPGSVWLSATPDRNNKEAWMQALVSLLRDHNMGESKVVYFVLPPSLVERLRSMEAQCLREKYQLTDTRRIDETTFAVLYEKAKNELDLEVKSMNVSMGFPR